MLFEQVQLTQRQMGLYVCPALVHPHPSLCQQHVLPGRRIDIQTPDGDVLGPEPGTPLGTPRSDDSLSIR